MTLLDNDMSLWILNEILCTCTLSVLLSRSLLTLEASVLTHS